MKKYLLILMACSWTLYASTAPKLPQNWYQGAEWPQEKNYQESSVEELQEITKKYLSVNEEAFQKTLMFSQNHKSLSDWELQRFIMSLGIGLKGTLGLLTMGGKGSFQFHYFPKKENKNLANLNDPESSAHEFPLELGPQMNFLSIKKQVENVARGVESTGKVKNPSLLRAELTQHANAFVEFAQALAATKMIYDWHVTGLELQLMVEASGKVQPEIDVGGELRVRIRWLFVPTTKPKMTVLNDQQVGIKNFVEGLGTDLSVVTRKSVFSEFVPDQIIMALGFTAKGNISMVKAKGDVEFRVLFGHRPQNKSEIRLDSEEEKSFSGYDFYDNYNAAAISYAEQNHIPFTIVEENKSSFRKVIYHLGRERVRRGLERTFKMTNFFLDLARGREFFGWELGLIRTRYDFSVEGVLPFMSIGGKAMAEIAFIKQGR